MPRRPLLSAPSRHPRCPRQNPDNFQVSARLPPVPALRLGHAQWRANTRIAACANPAASLLRLRVFPPRCMATAGSSLGRSNLPHCRARMFPGTKSAVLSIPATHGLHVPASLSPILFAVRSLCSSAAIVLHMYTAAYPSLSPFCSLKPHTLPLFPLPTPCLSLAVQLLCSFVRAFRFFTLVSTFSSSCFDGFLTISLLACGLA